MLNDFFDFISAWKVWHALFHGFIWMDWVLLAACIAAVITGALRGFGFFFGKLIGVLILVFAVLIIYPTLSEWAIAHLTFAKAGFWNPVFFLLISAFFLWVLFKVNKFQSKKGPVQFHPFWDRVVGAAAGFFYVLLIASFAAQFFLMLPGKKIRKTFEKGESRYGIILRDFTPQLVDGVLTPIRTVLNHKIPRS